MANMTGQKVVIPVEFRDANKSAGRMIEQIQEAMKNLKVGSSVEKSVGKQYSSLTKEFSKIQEIMNKGLINGSDTTKLVTAFSKVHLLVNNISQDLKDASISSIALSSKDLKSLQEANDKVVELSKKIQNLKNTKVSDAFVVKKDQNILRNADVKLGKNVLQEYDALKKSLAAAEQEAEKLKQELEELKKSETELLQSRNSLESNAQNALLGIEGISTTTIGKNGKEIKRSYTSIASDIQKALKPVINSGQQDWVLEALGFDQETISKLNIEDKARVIKQKFLEELSKAETSEDRQSFIKDFLDKSLNSIDNQKVDIDKKLLAIDAARNGKDAGDLADLKEQIEAYKKALPLLERVQSDLNKQINQVQGKASDTSTDTLVGAQKQLQQLINTFKQLYLQVNGSLDGFENLLGKAQHSVNESQNAQAEAESFKKSLNNAVNRWFTLRDVINRVKQGIRQAYRDIQGLDKAMANIAVVTDMSIEDLWGKINEYMSIAKQYGVTTQGVYEVSQLYYQQGLNTAEVTELTTETLKLARVANMDYAASADAMTVALRGFKMEMSEAATVTDVYSKVAAITASDQAELATAMSKTASSAASVGSSFENTTAMLAVMVETTRESAQNLGSAMKSIISRYGEMKVGVTVDSEGEALDYNKVDTALKSIGISLKDAQGQFRDFDDVIFELSAKWGTLDTNTQRYIATIMAGNRQQSRFIALVDNWERLQEVSEAAADSQDAGLLQYAKTMDSLETKINNIKTSFQQFYMNIINGPVISKFFEFINNIIEGFNKLGNWQSVLNLVSLMTSIKTISSLLVNTFSTAFGETITNAKTRAQQLIEISRQSGYDQAKAEAEGRALFENGSSRPTGQTAGSQKSGRIKLNAKQAGVLIANLAGTGLTALGSRVSSSNIKLGANLSALGTAASYGALGLSLGGGIGAAIGAIAGLTASLPALVKALDRNTQAEEELAAKQEISNKANIERAQKKDEYKSLQEALSKYEEYKESRFNSDEDYQNWIDVNNQLVEAYPELIGYIDEEGNAIADVTNATEILKESMVQAAEASRAYYKAKVDEVKSGIDYNKGYQYILNEEGAGFYLDFLKEIGAYETGATGIAQAIGLNNAYGFTNEQLFNWLNKKGLKITDFVNFEQSKNSDIQYIGTMLKNFKVLEKNNKGYYDINQTYFNYQNAKAQENLLKTYSKGSATANLSLLSSYDELDNNVQEISSYQTLLYTLIGNIHGMTDEKISELTIESKVWENTIGLLEDFYDSLSSSNKEVFSAIYDNLDEYSSNDLNSILSSLGLEKTDEIYKAIEEDWYNTNYKEGYSNANAFKNLYLPNDIDLQIPDYNTWLDNEDDSSKARQEYYKHVKEEIRKLDSDLYNLIYNNTDSTLSNYLSYLEIEDAKIENGADNKASQRKDWIKTIMEGISNGSSELSKLFEKDAEAMTEFYSIIFTNVGSYDWGKNLKNYAEKYSIDSLQDSDIDAQIFELYPTVVNALEESVAFTLESMEDYLSMQKDGWEISKAKSFAKDLGTDINDIFTNIGGKILLRSTSSITEWYKTKLADIQNRLELARSNTGEDLSEEEIKALQEEEQLVLNQMKQAEIDLYQQVIDNIKTLTSILSGGLSGAMEVTDLVNLGTYMQSEADWSSNAWADFQSEHISQLPSGEFKIDFEGVAELATELDLVGTVWEDLVDSFESIEDVENMWKDLGSSIDGATKIILKNIEAIKRADASDAMFDFMGQDMDSYADTYKTMAENLDDWSGVMTEAMEKGTMGIADFWNISRVMSKSLEGPQLEAWNKYAQTVMATAKTTEGGIVSLDQTIDGFGSGLEAMQTGMEKYYKDLANQQVKIIDAQIAALKAQEAAEEAINSGRQLSKDELLYTGYDAKSGETDTGIFTQEQYSKALSAIDEKYMKESGDAAGLTEQEAAYKLSEIYLSNVAEALKKGLDVNSVEIQQMIRDSSLAEAGVSDYSNSLDEFVTTNELLSNIDTNVASIVKEESSKIQNTSSGEETGTPETSSQTPSNGQNDYYSTNSVYYDTIADNLGPRVLEQEAQIADLKLDNAELNASVEELNAQLATYSASESSLAAELLSVQEERDILNTSLIQKEEELRLANAEKEKLNKEIAQLTEQNNYLTSLHNDKITAESEIQQALDEANSKLAAAESELAKSKEKEKSLNDEITALKTEISNLQESLGEKVTAESDVQLALDEANDKLSSAEKTITSLNSEITSLTESIAKKDEEIANLKAIQSQNTATILSLKAQLNDANKKIAENFAMALVGAGTFDKYDEQLSEEQKTKYAQGAVKSVTNEIDAGQDVETAVKLALYDLFGEGTYESSEVVPIEDVRTFLNTFAQTGFATVDGVATQIVQDKINTYLNPPTTDTQDQEEAGTQAAEEYTTGFEKTVTENPPTAPVKADTEAAKVSVEDMIKYLSSKNIVITVTFQGKYQGPGGFPLSEEDIKLLYNANGGPSNYAGNVSGLALYNGANLANKTLVGELGPELAVYDNMYHLLGQNGAEFVNLPDDAIVFNHRQTEGIIRGQAGYRGKALVNGNVSGPAYASGTSAAIQKLEEAKAMWQAIADMDVESLLGAASGGGGGGGDNSVKAHIEDLEEWYNLLRQIENLEQKISNIQAERANIDDGHEYLRSLREEQALLEKQVTTQEILLDYQQKQLKLQADQINQNKIWSQFLTVGEDGLLQYKKGNEANGGKGALEVLQDLNQMSGKEQQAFMKQIGYSYTDTDGNKLKGEELVAKFYEELQAQIDAYDELYDTVNETEETLEGLETSIREVDREILENQMTLETAVYEALVSMREKEIEQLEEQVDLIKEANEAYIDGIQKAIQSERDMYEKNESISDREQLQRRLALLKMSNGSASEIADLEAQLDETLKNEYFSRQEESLDAIRDASDKQIERLDNQIRIMEENLAYQKENGLLWQKVYDIMANDDASILNFISGNNTTFIEKSVLEQKEMLDEWAKQIGIYKEDQDDKYNTKKGYSIWDKDYSGNNTLSGLNDDQRTKISDEFASAYAKHIGAGMTEEDATKAAWKDVQQTISNFKSENEKPKEEPKKDSSSGNKKNSSSSNKNTTFYKKVNITTSAGNKGGIPYPYSKTVNAGDSFTVYPRVNRGYEFDYMTYNGTRKNSTTIKTTGKVKDIAIVVYYKEKVAKTNSDPELHAKTGAYLEKDTIVQAHKGEGIMTAKETEAFYDLVENYRKMTRFDNPLLSFVQSHKDALSSKINNTNNGGNTVTVAPGAVQIAVAQLNDKYDVDELANDVMNRMVVIANKSTNRGVNRR